jgi:hypothetical protein
MGRGSHSHRSVSRPGRRWPGTCSRACRTGWRRLAAGEEASSAIAGPGRAGARPSHAALGGTSSKRAEAVELTAPADRSGTRTGTIFSERGILGAEAELHSLIRNPSSRPILSQLQHAACQGMDPGVYHPDEGRPTDLVLARCFSCRARLACLGLALRAEDPEARSGWYGGLGPDDRDALAASLGGGKPSAAQVTDTEARAVRLRAAGWTIDSIADELRCCRRTVQRYLRKAAA